MDFGYTNDEGKFQATNAFREAAVADGWSISPTYSTEPDHSHATLKREGFTLMICTRRDVGRWKYQAQVSAWGPDGLSIDAPDEYDWQKIASGVERCLYCGRTDKPVTRVGFAGRSCADCLPEQRKRQEYKGWTL